MAILWSFVALLAGLGAGALSMRWHVQRTREIAEQEDSRDTQIRELLAALKIARADLARAREEAAATSAGADETSRRLAELDEAVARSHTEHNETRELLDREIVEKSRLQEELHQLRRECEALKTRAQELELELQAAGSAELLDPALQVG